MNRHMAAGHKNAGTDFGLRRRRLLIGMSSGHQEKFGEDFFGSIGSAINRHVFWTSRKIWRGIFLGPSVLLLTGLSFGHQKLQQHGSIRICYDYGDPNTF